METLKETFRKQDLLRHWPQRNKIIALVKLNKNSEDIAKESGVSIETVHAIILHYQKLRRIFEDDRAYNMFKTAVDIIYLNKFGNDLARVRHTEMYEKLETKVLSYL